MSFGDVFIARQPIFDRRNAVSGYEILFRSGPENRFLASDVDLAASQSLERTLMSFGLDELTAGQPAFVNVSQRVLLSELYTLLPAQKAVIELLETVSPTAEVIHACDRLKRSGYRLALDDFVYQPSLDPLLELADVVKIDFRQAESRSSKSIAMAGRYGAELLAEKVETQEERSEADRLGFTLFQGYFFCQPELIRNRVP